MARIPFATRDNFPDDLTYAWDRTMERPDPTNRPTNIFLTMSNNARVCLAATRFSREVIRHCGLSHGLRELAILRCAFVRQAPYEWHQHVRSARAAGLSDETIRAVGDWRSADGFSDAERALLAYVDDLAGPGTASDQAFSSLQSHFSNEDIVGITMLVGMYTMTAIYLNSMAVEPEQDFVGWNLENNTARPS